MRAKLSSYIELNRYSFYNKKRFLILHNTFNTAKYANKILIYFINFKKLDFTSNKY